MEIDTNLLDSIKGSPELPYKFEVEKQRVQYYKEWYRQWAASEYYKLWVKAGCPGG